MTAQLLVTLNDGFSMPQLGLGVWRTPQDEAAFVVKTAVEAGYRSIDTASFYGNERGVGEALNNVPNGGDVFLTTKLWNDEQGYDRALKGFEDSLHRLGRESVDLYLIHWPAPQRGLYVETWRALIRLRKEGRAKSIGVSNFEEDQLRRIIGETGVIPAVNQIELHPRFQQSGLRSVHASLGIATESWSPLGQGQSLANPVLLGLATKHAKSPAQIVIRWHLQSNLIVIPKSITPGRIVENFDVFGFSLDEDDMAAIDGLDCHDGRIGPDPAAADF